MPANLPGTASTRPTSFADIVRLLADLPALPSVPDNFRIAVYADPQLALHGERREALLWLGQGQCRFPPKLGAAGTVGIALYAGPHTDVDTDWQALLAPWQGDSPDDTAPALLSLREAPAVNLDLYDLAEAPIANKKLSAALTETQAAHAMAYGMMAAKPDLSLLALATVGDTATGAETSAWAVITALLKRDPTTLSLPTDQKAQIAAMLAANRAGLTDPLSILAALGGHESCAILGAMIAAQLAGYPVLLEGLPAVAALLTLAMLAGKADDLLGHVRVTSLPAVLKAALPFSLQELPGFTRGAVFGDACQIAELLPQLRVLTI